jgi:hypothetical protein
MVWRPKTAEKENRDIGLAWLLYWKKAFLLAARAVSYSLTGFPTYTFRLRKVVLKTPHLRKKHMTSFEEKPIVFLDYPFSLNAPMAKRVRTIRSISFGKEGRFLASQL